MTPVEWFILGSLVWLSIAVVVTVTVATGPGRREPLNRGIDHNGIGHDGLDPDDPDGGWLIYHCTHCNKGLEYLELEQLPVVKLIHERCCLTQAAPGGVL